MIPGFSGHMTVGVLEAPDLLSCLCKHQGRPGALHLILIPSWFLLGSAQLTEISLLIGLAQEIAGAGAASHGP